MKKELNIAEILKDCPKGTKLYSPLFGEVEFERIDSDSKCPIDVILISGYYRSFAVDGRYDLEYNGECMLFPSKDQRDWSKFVAPKPDLPEGTWVMCSDTQVPYYSWYIRKYYKQGLACSASDVISWYNWRYIIPFDKFDPSNIEECIKKYNYGKRKVN